MLKEAIDYLFQAGRREAAAVTIFDPRNYLAVRLPSGEIEFKEPLLGPHRDHALYSIPSFGAYVKAHQGNTGLSSVWYNREGIRFYADDDRREDVATVLLAPSPQMCLIDGWTKSGGNRLDVPGFYRLLRIDLRGCLENGADLIKAVGNVRASRDEEKEVKVGRGNASMGAKLVSEMKADGVPEFFNVNVPMFEAHVFSRQTIEVAIELDEKNGSFVLIPVPGQIEEAWAKAEEAVERQVREHVPEGTRVFYGEP